MALGFLKKGKDAGEGSKEGGKAGRQEAVIIHDLRGDIIDADSSAVSMIGYSPEELRKMNVKDFVNPGDFSKVILILKELIQKGKVDFSANIAAKSGKKMKASISSSVYEEAGQKRVKAVFRV